MDQDVSHQASCVEVEEIQPLQDCRDPFDHYRFVRKLFALSREKPSKEISEKLHLALKSPFTAQFQPTQLIQLGSHFVPTQTPSGAIPLLRGETPRIAESCQMVLLFSLFGLEEEAGKLAGWLYPLVKERFLHLWTQDTQFDLEECSLSTALFLRACGEEVDLERPKDPFFAYLYQLDLKITRGAPSYSEPLLGYQLLAEKNGAIALTLCGRKTGLGEIRVGGLRIVSFGPQESSFGIDNFHSVNGWFRSDKTSWFRLLPTLGDKKISFTLQQVGGKKGTFFAFYVVADHAKVGGKVVKPMTIQRFSGDSSQVEFGVEGGTYLLTLDRSVKVELIPLAGNAAFWGASFLCTFALPSFDTTLLFGLEQVVQN